VADSAAVQTCWTELRMERGSVSRRKIGRSSAAMQKDDGRADYGTLWSGYITPLTCRGKPRYRRMSSLPLKVEGEPYLISSARRRRRYAQEDVLEATEALAVSGGDRDSRIKEDWKIKLALPTTPEDTPGPWSKELVREDLPLPRMTSPRTGSRSLTPLCAAARQSGERGRLACPENSNSRITTPAMSSLRPTGGAVDVARDVRTGSPMDKAARASSSSEECSWMKERGDEVDFPRA